MCYSTYHQNDRVEAEAISEAAQRPTMHVVAVKTEEQQAPLSARSDPRRGSVVSRDGRASSEGARLPQPRPDRAPPDRVGCGR